MRYEGKIYRSPREGRSLIIQDTVGCSHNKCTFCNMYKDDQFRIRNIEDIIEDIDSARSTYNNINRVFLADGDVLMINNDKIKMISQLKQALDGEIHFKDEFLRGL